MDTQFNPTVPEQNPNNQPAPTQMPQGLPTEPVMTAPSPFVDAGTSNNTKKVGPIIAIFVILVVIIALAVYIFASNSNKRLPLDSSSVASEQTGSIQGANEANVTPAVQSITNTADDIDSIQADLNNSTNGIDSQNF